LQGIAKIVSIILNNLKDFVKAVDVILKRIIKIFNKMKKTITICLKWYKNDNGGDKRTITIDYDKSSDFEQKKNKILNDFRNKPLDVDYFNGGFNLCKIPYSVTVI
jgi:predicted RNA-binding protein with RPS1 domain